METESPLAIAIAAVGSQKRLAEGLRIRSPSITAWKVGNIPPNQCPAIEVLTGVTCEQLRPDLHWQRDADGRVIAYAVPLAPVETGNAAALAGVE